MKHSAGEYIFGEIYGLVYFKCLTGPLLPANQSSGNFTLTLHS